MLHSFSPAKCTELGEKQYLLPRGGYERSASGAIMYSVYRSLPFAPYASTLIADVAPCQSLC